MVGVALALAAALCYACGSVIEHQVARQQRPELALRLGLLVALARQPLWVIGFLVGVGAYGLEAAALAVGDVMTVAPLLVSGLLFALPLASHRSHRRMTSGEWAAAVALTGALAVFVTVGAPTGTAPTRPSATGCSPSSPWRWSPARWSCRRWAQHRADAPFVSVPPRGSSTG